mmetsp:Transcript_5162/g.6341  ORF Transcript_5162/g.6341 Transcript_5162/m.6341 type:complete len:126 (-) Transcript_5162:622-999(-)
MLVGKNPSQSALECSTTFPFSMGGCGSGLSSNPPSSPPAKIVNDHRVLAAAKVGNCELLKELIEMRASVLLKDDEGRTPLLLAAREGRSSAVRVLIDAKANVHTRDTKCWTPLLCASLKNSPGHM